MRPPQWRTKPPQAKVRPKNIMPLISKIELFQHSLLAFEPRQSSLAWQVSFSSFSFNLSKICKTDLSVFPHLLICKKRIFLQNWIYFLAQGPQFFATFPILPCLQVLWKEISNNTVSKEQKIKRERNQSMKKTIKRSRVDGFAHHLQLKHQL